MDGGAAMRQPLSADCPGSADVGPHAASKADWDRLLRCSLRSGTAEQGTWSLEWSDLKFSIGDKHILRGISGVLEPGHFTAILGPSGSGKSTLLNLLSGRQRTSGPSGKAPFSGEISVAGSPVTPAEMRSHIAYVMQDDRLMATETPRDCIEFSARMRRGGSVAERQALVKAMLATLGLDKCADTVVGSELLKGVSGGERKRASVGVELITDPKLLFLDEPLSGLDSYAAYTLACTLKELADAGVPVLCTVHQPSSEIFAMFDDVIVLHEGAVAFHGQVKQLAPYFARWERCPANFNPADHVMFLLQKQESEGSTMLSDIKAAWLASDMCQEIQQRIGRHRAEPGRSAALLGSKMGVGSHLGVCMQMSVLLRRECRGCLRNRGILSARFGMALALSVTYAWLFAGSARDGDDPRIAGNCADNNFDPSGCSTAFQAQYGTLVSLSIAAMMGAAQPVLLTFPVERPIFLREFAAKQYHVLPYFLSKTLVELPIVLVSQAILLVFAYFSTGMQGKFIEHVMVAFTLGVASSSLMLVIGCAVATAQTAIQLAPLALIPQMLFSGLFLPVSKIPASLRWVRYLCPLRYAINLAGVVEFAYIKERTDECERLQSLSYCSSRHPGDYLRKALLESNGIDFDGWEVDALVLVSLFFAFRLVAVFLLWRRGRYMF